MAIDRIGKSRTPPLTPETGAPAGAAETGASAPFRIESTAHAPPVGPARSVEGAEATSPLARLRGGEIDVHGYVDLKVEEATKSLNGLSAAELAEIKSVLRDQLRTDPGLADLVRAATGKMPSPPED